MKTAEEILQIDDLPRERVSVPEWDTDIYIRSMTALERDRYEGELLAANNDIKKLTNNARARLVARCAVNEQGERLFSDDQIDALGKKSAKAIGRLYDIAQRLNAISDEDIEDIAKNSEPDIGDDSTSASA